MTDIKTNYEELKLRVPDYVSIVAVTKTRSIEDIQTLYDCGHRIMGENRVQELGVKKRSA